MSHVEDLIDELAPDGVPIHPLGEVGTFVRGRRFTKEDRVDNGLPSIHYGEIYTHYGVAATSAVSHVRQELKPTLRFAQPGDVIIAAVGETVEDVGKAVAWLGTEPVAVHDDCFIFRSSLDPRFVVYFMQSAAFNKPKEAYVARAKVKRLSSDGLAKLRIPIPPAEVQQEIVRVLDMFSGPPTELATQLAAELEARRRQYALHREALLTFAESDQVRWVALGELAGTGLFNDGDWVESKNQDPAGGVRLTQLADVGVDVFRDRSDRWMREDQASRLGCTFLKPGDVLIARMPDPLGRACQVPDNIGRAVTVVDVAILRSVRSDVLPRYVMYAINSQMVNREILSFQTGGTRQRISRTNLGTVRIPLPSIEQQECIVAILDKFDALVTDLSHALLAEVAARRKQYEYYRDRLLTFKELAA